MNTTSTDGTDWSYTPSANGNYTVTKFNFTPNEPPEEVEEAVNAGWCKGTLLPHPRMPFVHVCVVCGMEVSDREIALNVKAEMTPYARFQLWKRIHQVRNKPLHESIPGITNDWSSKRYADSFRPDGNDKDSAGPSGSDSDRSGPDKRDEGGGSTSPCDELKPWVYEEGSGYRRAIRAKISDKDVLLVDADKVPEAVRAIENHRWLTDAHKDPRSERTLWRTAT